MSEAMKQVVIRTGSIVLAFLIIVVIVYMFNRSRKPCGCTGSKGVPTITGGDGQQPVTQQATNTDYNFDLSGFDFAN